MRIEDSNVNAKEETKAGPWEERERQTRLLLSLILYGGYPWADITITPLILVLDQE